MIESDTPNEAETQAIKQMFLATSDFVWGAQNIGQLPPGDLPEIGFVGRSNVGKSSLINALMQQRALAIVSRTPGRTRQLNAFTLGGRGLLVDMPGYGYAKISKMDRDIWDDMIITYLQGRAKLMGVFMLIDSRHGLRDMDKDVLKLLAKAAVSTRLILTKIDELKNDTQRDQAVEKLRADLRPFGSAHPEPLALSAHSGEGIETLRLTIARFILSAGG
ncbi:MAG: ribosome biogenesis GTP-binding protein YihA/YsxC [Pseudomonadota bacterium]